MGASSPRVGSASHHTHNPFSQARHWLCSGPAKARCWRIASLVGAVIVVHLVASVAVGTLNVGSSNSSHAAASSTSYSYAASSFGPRSLYSLSTSKAAASRNALSPSQSRTYSNPLLAKELGGNSTEPETDAEASAIAKEAAEDAAYAAAAARAAGNITERANPESAWPQPDLDGTASAPTAAVRKEALLDRLRKRKEAFARQRAEREQAQDAVALEAAFDLERAQLAEDTMEATAELPTIGVAESNSGAAPRGWLARLRAGLAREANEERLWLDRVADWALDIMERRWEVAQEAQAGAPASRPARIPGKKLWGKLTLDHVAPAGEDECAAALRIPKVAMMFLTRGKLHHEATWEMWFKRAEGALPVQAVREAGCTAANARRLQRICGAAAGPTAMQRQHLFNVYIHVGSNEKKFRGFPKDSIFHGRDIVERVAVQWGTFSLVAATRAMLRAGLRDPLNAKFVLLSESGIPLYPPQTLYQQLMSETKSRINACNTDPTWQRHVHRWSPKMETPSMTQAQWRKSWQWMAVTRSHASLFVNDTEVAKEFQDHCYETWEDGWNRDCFSDEHYFPTLLAVKGLDQESDCKGLVMNVDWSRGGPHPRAYTLREVSAARLRLLRMPTEGCGYPAAIKTADEQFVTPDAIGPAACTAPRPDYAHTIGYQCPLFARKFPPETAAAVSDLMRDCRNRLKIMHTGDDCESEARRRLALL